MYSYSIVQGIVKLIVQYKVNLVFMQYAVLQCILYCTIQYHIAIDSIKSTYNCIVLDNLQNIDVNCIVFNSIRLLLDRNYRNSILQYNDVLYKYSAYDSTGTCI